MFSKINVYCVNAWEKTVEKELKERKINFNSGPSLLDYFQGFYQYGLLVMIDDYCLKTRTNTIYGLFDPTPTESPKEITNIDIKPPEICGYYGDNDADDFVDQMDMNIFPALPWQLLL